MIRIQVLFFAFLLGQKHVCITCAQQMVENILDIVWHGCFPSMVLSGTSVILVSGFKGTF